MNQPALRGAVLDLGTNTFKFLLAEQRGHALTIHQEKNLPTRLGEGLESKRKLQPKAIRRALKALKECQQQVKTFKAEKFAVVGTNALRSATNSADFLIPAQKILGVPVQVLSGDLEAGLVYAGICSHPRWLRQEIFNIDIGGGSVEWIHGINGRVLSTQSFPVGCVRLRERFFRRFPASPAMVEKARLRVVEEMQNEIIRYRPFRGKLLASGGTITSLCAMYATRSEIEGFPLSIAMLKEALAKLSSMSLVGLKRQRRLPAYRADVIVPGTLILLALVEMFGKRSVICATRGLRYGVWIRQISGQAFTRIQRQPHRNASL